MIKYISRALCTPSLTRSLARRLVRAMQLGSYEDRIRLSAVNRPHYAYCVYNAAVLARKLGYNRISVLEFGVAGGNGLVNLEYQAEEVKRYLAIDVDIYGFDTGEGLPKPEDYRDLPYHWKGGHFKMDVLKLRARLKKAQLVLGDVRETIAQFHATYNPAPIGAVMFDLDFYSSTVAALRVFDGNQEHFLPRIFCYLDDVIGTEVELYNEFTGVLLAIHEFNQRESSRKFGTAYNLLASRIVEPWYHQIRTYHDFKHPRYNDFVSSENQQIKLKP